MKELREMCDLHNISIPKNIGRKMMLTYFHNHHCIQCDLYASLFTEKEKIKRVRLKKEKREKIEHLNIPLVSESSPNPPSKFPPDPPSNLLIESIIKGFCNDTTPWNFIEAGCAVCGRLSLIANMTLLDEINCDLEVISPGDVGRYERLHKSDPVMSLKGPILAEGCSHVCESCLSFLKKKKAS